jgi:basic amino acid/polyamine antiporter, APA family
MTPDKQAALANPDLPNPELSNQGFVKGLGLTSATTLVMGSMIGSGIFIVSADLARQVKSPGLLILCWLIG